MNDFNAEFCKFHVLLSVSSADLYYNTHLYSCLYAQYKLVRIRANTGTVISRSNVYNTYWFLFFSVSSNFFVVASFPALLCRCCRYCFILIFSLIFHSTRFCRAFACLLFSISEVEHRRKNEKKYDRIQRRL